MQQLETLKAQYEKMNKSLAHSMRDEQDAWQARGAAPLRNRTNMAAHGADTASTKLSLESRRQLRDLISTWKSELDSPDA